MIVIFLKKIGSSFENMSVFSIQEIKKNVKKGHRILRGWTLGAAVFQISLLYICL